MSVSDEYIKSREPGTCRRLQSLKRERVRAAWMFMCLCVCMCVCEGEGDRQREAGLIADIQASKGQTQEDKRQMLKALD